LDRKNEKLAKLLQKTAIFPFLIVIIRLKQTSMIISCYTKMFLLIVIILMSENSVHSHNVGDSSSAENDSLQAEGLAGIGEKVLNLVTWERDGFVFTMYPSIGVSPRNGFVYGVMPAVKWDSPRDGMFNTIAVNAEHSTTGMLQLQEEHEWYFHPLWLTTGEAFVNSREDLFWVGDEQEELYFDRNEFRIEGDLSYNLFPNYWVGGGLLININRFDENATELFERDRLVGAEGGLILGVGPNMVFDSRHRTLAPQRGAWIQLLPLLAGLGDYEYQKITFDGRKYFSLSDESTTLAFQTIVDYATEGVPFFEEPHLGGKERLRGIGHPMRETGNAVWLARAEVRQHLWWRLGVVAFAGLGKAGDHFKEPFEDVISSLGGGLRFRMLPDDPLNVRFDFGVSSTGQSGFFISLKEAF
jgi:hypothetical protein